MKKVKIKIKIIGFSRNLYNPKGYLLQFLKNESNFEIVEKNQDLIITTAFSFKEVFKENSTKKILIFSGENPYTTANEKFFNQILKFSLFWTDKVFLKYALFNLVKKIIPHLNRFLPYHFLINDCCKFPNIFGLFGFFSNSIQFRKIFSFPLFFDGHLGHIDHFIEIKKKRLYINQKKNFCAFIVSNPTANDRIDFFKKLSKYKKIDSFGIVLNNTKIPEYLIKKYKYEEVDLDTALKADRSVLVTDFCSLNQELFREYKFVICFENSYANDWVDRKITKCHDGKFYWNL